MNMNRWDGAQRQINLAAVQTRKKNKKKHPVCAERPDLPWPCATVPSAMRGLTAEFGMGSGDPPLHGSAHTRCSS